MNWMTWLMIWSVHKIMTVTVWIGKMPSFDVCSAYCMRRVRMWEVHVVDLTVVSEKCQIAVGLKCLKNIQVKYSIEDLGNLERKVMLSKKSHNRQRPRDKKHCIWTMSTNPKERLIWDSKGQDQSSSYHMDLQKPYPMVKKNYSLIIMQA